MTRASNAVLMALLSGCATSSMRDELRAPKSVTALSESQSAQLRDLLAELARPPFGTGAVLSISLTGSVTTVAEGVAWDGGPRVQAGTRFNVASVSKLLTAAKIVALAHDGKLSLDDSVALRLPGVVLVDADGRQRSAEVTLRQLLMHRGGLPHQPGALDPKTLGSEWTDRRLLERLTSSWSISLVRPPGDYGYSNMGYALLGAIIERTEKRSFADAMQAYLESVGMRDSSFWPVGLTDAAHGRVEQNGAVRFNDPDWYASRYALPFTGLWATMPDMARFGQALLAAQADPAAPLHEMTVRHPSAQHGLGPIHRERFGLATLEHDGGGPGFSSWLVVLPDRGVVLAIACNGDGESRDRAARLFEITRDMLGVIIGRP